MAALAANRPAMQRRLAERLRSQLGPTKAVVYLQGQFAVLRLPGGYKVGATATPNALRGLLEPVAAIASEFSHSFDLIVEGRADATPMRRGSSRSNWSVAFDRAGRVAEALSDLDISGTTPAVASRGDGLPSEMNPLSANNRRIELVFAPKRSGPPSSHPKPPPPSHQLTAKT